MIIAAALVLGLIEWRIVHGNVGAAWNGYGAINGVLSRTALAPMRYRVMVPWLVGWMPEPARLMAYQAVKTGLLYASLWMCTRWLNLGGFLVLCVLVISTFLYDYWDCYAELLAVALCLTGQPLACAIGGLVWGLSRETAALAMPLAFLAGGLWPGLAALTGPLALGAVRLVQGRAKLYCQRTTWTWHNKIALRDWRGDPAPGITIAWTAGGIAAACLGIYHGGPLASTAPMALAWLAGGWLLGSIRETRVFMPVALWLAWFLTT